MEVCPEYWKHWGMFLKSTGEKRLEDANLQLEPRTFDRKHR